MEFAFEDGLFENNNNDKDKLKTVSEIRYVPKHCYAEWFSESVINESSTLEECIEFTHNADLHFYRQQYTDAKDKYKLLLNCKACHENNPIMRESYENIIRCCLKLSQFKEAVSYLKPLFDLHGNNNDCSINLLACKVYCNNSLYKDAVQQALITVNVNQMHPGLWLNLYDMIVLLLKSGKNSFDIENEECRLTDRLKYQILSQAKFLVHESLRYQDGHKIDQYKQISDEIDDKMNAVIAQNPHAQKNVVETVCPVVNVHEGVQSNQTLTVDSFIWNWLKRNA